MILVTGGTGFVGRAVVRELLSRGRDAAVLTRDAQTARAQSDAAVEYREGDVREPATLTEAMRGITVVVGSQQFPGSPMENPGKGRTFEQVDAIGTENLVAAAKAAGVEKYVYLSGVGAAKDADRHWFRAKWRAEEAVRNSGMTYTIIRPSWVYGPDDNALNRFLGMSRFLPFVPLIGNPGKQKMQPVFIDDVARAVAEAVDNPAADNKEYELGGPEVLTMSEVVKTALDVSGRKRLVLAMPAFVMKLVASVVRFAPGPPLTPDAIDFIMGDALADPTKMQEDLGIEVTPLHEALGTYLR